MSVDPCLINRTAHPEPARGAITRAAAFFGTRLHFARVSVQILLRVTNGQKTGFALGAYPKGQFFKNMVYLKRGMPYFVFVDTNAVLVRKIDKA